ncbi:MAG: pentapeptide repeat protein [Solimicrobium sp.]|jgi:uncharacterized protein YjbI with pentapeptide repeats|nr:pentapeptide repeat protein [Solimicrobium sp.]
MLPVNKPSNTSHLTSKREQISAIEKNRPYVVNLEKRIAENHHLFDSLKSDSRFQNILTLFLQCKNVNDTEGEIQLLNFLSGKASLEASLEACLGKKWMINVLVRTYDGLESKAGWFTEPSHFLTESLASILSAVFRKGNWETMEKTRAKMAMLIREIKEEDGFGKLNLVEADLSGIGLAGADLAMADLTGADLTKADLTGANCSEVQFFGANLQSANLTRANLSKANLEEANLVESDLTRANLNHANLIEANLTGANLTKAKLRGADLYHTNWTRAILTGVDFTGGDLTNANLAGANLYRANLTGVNLTSANLTGAKLPKAGLAQAQFCSSNLTEINITSAHGRWANIDRSEFV